MIFDIQKAMFWKRASAWLFDLILLGILTVGAAFGLSAVLNYDGYSAVMEDACRRYETQYHVSLELTQQQYEALTPDRQQAFRDASEALASDPEAGRAYTMMVNLTLVITTVSILIAFLILEFAVPLALGNGQTLGKKIFSLAVVHTNGVKISAPALFIRSVLGKYTIETMIPVYVVILITLGVLGLAGTVLILGLLAAQLILLFANRSSAVIHDLLARTVVVDFASQMIFSTEEEMLAYKKEVSAQASARADY